MLRDCINFSHAYIDNVAIFSMMWTEHLYHLRTVLGLIQEEGLTIQPQKTQLATQTCKFLGHIVGHSAISPQAVKIEAVKEFRQPVTKIDVRAFLGLVCYYHQFINYFSLLAVLLSDPTKKDRPDQVAWTDECATSFQALKDSLCSDAILRPPRYDRPFCLQTVVLAQY